MSSTPVELTYKEASQVLGLSLRDTKRKVLDNPQTVLPIRYGHRTVFLRLDHVLNLKTELRRKAMQGAK